MQVDVAAVHPVEAAPALDRAALVEEWVGTYGEGVLRLAHLYVQDRHLAEDVFQEVFTRVYLHLDRFRGDASPKTWIYRIAMNVCHDRTRSWSTRKLLLLGEDLLTAARDGAADPDQNPFAAVDASVLLQAVHKLPPEYRAVILLFYYEDLDVAEVAVALGLPAGTVRSRLHRARQKLKLLLLEGGWAE